MNKYITRNLLILLSCLFFFTRTVWGQNPSNYCYYPQDKTKVPHTESLALYVQSFNPKDISLAEFVVLDNGHPAKDRRYRFSVDAPSPKGNTVDFTVNDNNTFRLYPGSYLKGKNSVNVYVSRNPFNGEYAGPITLVSSNGNQNADYATECRNANDQRVKDRVGKKPQQANIDTGLLWNFRSPETVSVQKGGSKAMVVKSELVNARILPTKGMEALIEHLNPAKSDAGQYKAGTTLKLPVFRQPDEKQVQTMELQIQKDTSKDEIQNQLITVKTKNFSNVLKILERLKADGEYMEILRKSEGLLNKIVFNLATIKFKRYHAVMINTEIEKLTNYLLRMAAGDNLSKINSSYIASFNTYILDIINPYYYQKKSGRPTGFNATVVPASGLMSARDKLTLVSPADLSGADQEYLFSIHVFIPVPRTSSFDYKDSMRRYWVYVLAPFQYDNLNDAFIDMDLLKKNGLPPDRLNKMITKADLDGTGARCDALASITSKSFDFGKSYHFIVVSDISGEIVIHDYIENTADISPHSNDKNIPELYGIGLFQPFKTP